jgi:hypothetical protein
MFRSVQLALITSYAIAQSTVDNFVDIPITQLRPDGAAFGVPVISLQIGVVGLNPQVFNVLIDSSFAGLLLHSSQCSDCNGPMLYTPSSKKNQISNSVANFEWVNQGLQQMSTYQLSGFNFKDRVCIPTKDASLQKLCMDDLKFTASLFPMNLPANVDGVLGVGPSQNNVIGDPLLKLLEERRIIGYSAFSLFFG